MEANELYNFTISPLVTAPFSLEWSEDNHISLITHRGVHVFEFVPHPMSIYPTLQFWRTFVYPSEYLPAESFQSFVNDSLLKMPREEMYNLLLQEAMTPKINERTSIKPRIIRVSWSPVKLAEPSKCLLAIVTSGGSIEVLHKLGNDWYSVWNLTERWFHRVVQETKIDPADLTQNTFVETSWSDHIKRLLGTALCWSPRFDDDEISFAYLVGAYRSSEIIIARVERIIEISEAREPCIIHKSSLKTTSRIEQLLWCCLEERKRHVIIIGYADGKIHGLRIDEKENNKFSEEKLLKYEDRADRAKPMDFRLVRQDNGNCVILVTKSSSLIALSLDVNGECVKKRYLRIEGFSITGLTLLNNETVIVTTQDCRIYAITINENEDMRQILVRNDLKKSKLQFLGIASSPNSTILLNITSPGGTYDHLILRDPSTVQIFSLLCDQWNPWLIINKSIDKNPTLRKYWDCIESLRINASKSLEPEKILPKLPTNLDGLTIDRLRVIMWLTLITQLIEKKQMLKGVDKIVGEISEAQPLIFLISACKHLDRLSAKKSLNEDERRSASFLRMYMEIYLAGEEEDNEFENSPNDLTARVLSSFRSSSHIDTIETEICNLCDEIISELPWIIDKCPKGHKLPRCSISLLQITTVKYRTCPICERLFHPSLDHEYQEILCIYCDVPAIYDIRVRSTSTCSVAFETRMKNLSKRPENPMMENMRINVDMENSGATQLVNEKIRRRGLKPHTFAVIVNRDQDDDSLITETWQEF